jgi:hypothetical protein
VETDVAKTVIDPADGLIADVVVMTALGGGSSAAQSWLPLFTGANDLIELPPLDGVA